MNAPIQRFARSLAGWRVPEGSPSLLRVEQVLPLDPRRRLCLVQCGTRRLLLLTGGPNDVALGWLPPETPEASS